jgi:hypothetical protein
MTLLDCAISADLLADALQVVVYEVPLVVFSIDVEQPAEAMPASVLPAALVQKALAVKPPNA